jgi:sugar fermentation stimulation protein A
MKFNKKLLQGTLIKRYKRFFADINYKKKIITAHCPNPGSMMGLLDKGNKVWFSTSNNPKRKLKYTLEIIEVKNKKIGINTLLANKIVFEALINKKIDTLIKFNNIKPEVRFSDKT